ncbi:MAG: EF-hand domain-containing protein [Thermomonas sp.]
MLKLNSNNTFILSLALAACIAAPTAFAQDAQSKSQPPQAAQQMQQEAPPAADSQMAATADKPAQKSWSELDANSNGSLSSNEAAPMESLAKVFDKADADGNGELTQDEYKAWLAMNNAKQQPKQGG